MACLPAGRRSHLRQPGWRPLQPQTDANRYIAAGIANNQARSLEIMEEVREMLEPAAGRANGGAELASQV